jgi:RNA polymerase sigma factor (sigma-70 family)
VNAPLRTPELDRSSPAAVDPDFEALYRDNYAFVWRCARRMCVAESEVEDVVQDVFVIAYRRRERLAPGVKPSTWLFGILRNVVRNRARGRGRRLRRVKAFAEQVDARERQRRRLETALGERFLAGDLLAGFLRELDEGQRAVFVLAELEGYTGREIAEALGINPNTAHSRLRLARRAFCAHFGLEPERGAVSSATRRLREQPEQPPEQVQARAWGLVVAAVAAPQAWWAAPAGAVLSLISSKAGLALAGVAVAASLGGAVILRAPSPAEAREHRSEAHEELAARGDLPATRASVAPSPAHEAMDGMSELEPLPIPVQAPDPPPRRRAQRTKPSPAEQLRAARAALVAGEPARALELLDTIPASDSRLLEPRGATRVAALCKLGEVEAAKATLAQLREREPGSGVLARIEGACW